MSVGRHTRTVTAEDPASPSCRLAISTSPRTCFSLTGIGIVNHDIMDNLSQLHCVFDIMSGALSSGLLCVYSSTPKHIACACMALLGT